MSLIDKLLGWWDFEADFTPSSGGATFSQNNSPAIVSGKVGNAVDFRNSANSEYLYSSDDLFKLTGSKAFCGWFRFDTFHATVNDILGRYVASGTYEYTLNWRQDLGRLIWIVSGTGTSTTAQADFIISLSASTWYWIYVDLNIDTGKARILVNDGSIVTSTNGVFTPFVGSVPFVLGTSRTHLSSVLWVDGQCDSFAVFNEPLTSDERAVLYNSGSGHSFASVEALIPDDPSDLDAATTPANRNVSLTWTDNSSTETGFEIERSVVSDSAGFSLIAIVDEDTESYVDLPPGGFESVWYRVRAANDVGESDYSTVAQADLSEYYMIPKKSSALTINLSRGLMI